MAWHMIATSLCPVACVLASSPFGPVTPSGADSPSGEPSTPRFNIATVGVGVSCGLPESPQGMRRCPESISLYRGWESHPGNWSVPTRLMALAPLPAPSVRSPRPSVQCLRIAGSPRRFACSIHPHSCGESLTGAPGCGRTLPRSQAIGLLGLRVPFCIATGVMHGSSVGGAPGHTDTAESV